MASLPSFRAGWGGWRLTGPFPVLRPSRRAGEDGGQGTTLTHDNRSYVLNQKSLNVNVPTNHSIPNSDNVQSVRSSRPFSPQLGNPVSLLPMEAREAGSKAEKLSLIASHSSKSLPGTSGCPSGDSDRGLTNPRFSLQPRRPNKSPWISESRKQNENPESISSPIYYSPYNPNAELQSYAESLQIP